MVNKYLVKSLELFSEEGSKIHNLDRKKLIEVFLKQEVKEAIEKLDECPNIILLKKQLGIECI